MHSTIFTCPVGHASQIFWLPDSEQHPPRAVRLTGMSGPEYNIETLKPVLLYPVGSHNSYAFQDIIKYKDG